jgi:putative restriction endonuclease
VQTEHNLPGHILTLRDRPIFTPGENQYRPAQDNMDRHRSILNYWNANRNRMMAI